MARDKGLGSRNVPKGPRKRFKDLSKPTQAQRIDRAEEAGRLSAEKAAAARRHWGLKPKAADRSAAIWAAEQNVWPPVRPPVTPTEIDRSRAEHRDLVRRGRGVDKPRFVAPPPPPRKPKDARRTSAARYGWAIAAPARREAEEMIRRTMPVERQTEIARSRRYTPPPPPSPFRDRGGWRSLDPIENLEALGGFLEQNVYSPLRQLPSRAYSDLFDPEQQAEIRSLVAESGRTATAGGDVVGSVLGRGAAKPLGVTAAGAEAAGFGDVAEVLRDASEITHNFVRNVSQGAVGLGPAAVMAATRPSEITEAILDFYNENFVKTAREGEWGEFAANLKENPDVLLDLLGFGGAVVGTGRRLNVARRAAGHADMVEATAAGAALKALRTGKEPVRLEDRFDAEGNLVRKGRVTWGKETPIRFQKVVEREPSRFRRIPGRRIGTKQTPVQLYVSRNRQGQALGEAWDAIATRIGMGAGRRKKAIRETAEVDRARLFGPIERFRGMSQRVQKSPAQSIAFDRMLTRGGTPEEQIGDIKREIQLRREQGLNETQAQRDMITALESAVVYLQDGLAGKRGFDNFLNVVEEGRVLSNRTQNLLIEARLLRPETAERILNQPMEWLEGPVQPIDSPLRDSIEATLRSQDWDPDLIEAALAYMDIQATSFARRNNTTPDAFYREIYHSAASVDAEDFMSALNDGNEDVWITQTTRSDETLFEVSEQRAGQHVKAHRALTSRNRETRRAANARAQPKGRLPGGVVTIPTRMRRILNEIPNADERAEIARWYADIHTEFARYFGDETAAAVRAWLASQVATSPAGGLTGLLKAMEYKYLNGRWPEKGYNVNIVAMGKAWDNVLGTDPAGVAAKISDFFNSAYGQGTRSWLQHAPGYGPGVVDRWTLRSDGFVDHQAYSYLTKLGVRAPDPKADPSFYDMSAGPNAWQYEWASIRLNRLTKMFNDQRIDGRGDWSVEQVQALDWFATRREWGEPGGGWDDTWARNTHDIIGEVTGEQVRDWLREGERGALVTEVAHNGAHGRVEILGTRTQAVALAKKLANESGRTSYTFYTAGKEASGKRRLGVDIVPSDGADAEMIFDALRVQALDLVDEGILVLPHGNGGMRIMFADSRGQPIKGINARKRRDELVDQLKTLNIEARPIAAQMGVHHGSRPNRSLYRGVDPRGVFARGAAARRRGTDFRVGEVAGRDGAERFIAGLQRNARSWSLSPRAVEDFTERGYRAFLSDDGMAGAAVSPDGEIVSVFNSGADKGLGAQAIMEALANGGHWLNAYDGFLPAMYANVGFREVARLKFDDVRAPADWTYENGRPDIVFMAFAPHLPIRRGRTIPASDKAWDQAATRARTLGQRALNERSLSDLLTELADRGDGMPHATPDGQVLTQWKRKVVVTEGDPVVQGAVRITDEGVDLRLTNAANFSTLVHENAHATLAAGLRWLEQGDDPRLPEVLTALGLRSIGDLQDANKTRRTQELWARTVEAALYVSGNSGLITAPHMRRLLSGTQTEMKKAYRQGVRQIAGEEFGKETIENLLQNDALMSLIGDLHNAVYGVRRRPDAVFIPRISPTSSQKVARIIQRVSTSPSVGAVTPPRGQRPVAAGRRQGIREEQATYARGPDVVAGYATSAMRREVRQGVADEIMRSPEAKPIGRTPDGGFEFLPDHVMFDYSKVPGVGRQLDERLGLQEQQQTLIEEIGTPLEPDMSPQEIFEETKRATDETFSDEVVVDPRRVDMMTGAEQDRLAQLIDGGLVVQVPRRLVDEYLEAVGGSTVLSAVGKAFSQVGWLGTVGGMFLDGLTATQRWAMVLRGGYFSSNTIGAATTATMYNPFWMGEMKKALDHHSDWPVDGLHALDDMGGMGSYEMTRLLQEGTSAAGVVRRAEQAAYTRVSGAMTWPERRVRRMLVSRVLKDAGYETYEDFMGLVEAARVPTRRAGEPDADFKARQDAAALARAKYNQLARWAEDGAIRFRGMNDFEKALVRRGIFVYSWIRASLRYTARFPINNPVMAAMMNRIGNEGWDNIQEVLEKEIGFRGGLPLGERINAANEREVRMADLSSIFPFGAGAETMRVGSGMFSNLFGTEPFAEKATDMLNNGALFGLALVQGEGAYGRTPVEQGFGGFTKEGGFASIPFFSWVARLNDPTITETKTYGKQAQQDIVGQFMLGQLYPRWTKVDGAHAVWLRQQPRERAVPMRESMQADKLLNRYASAVEVEGDVPIEEYMRATQARTMYKTLDGLAGRLEGTDAENEAQRARWKGKVLEKFYPEAYDDLYVSLEGSTVDEAVILINRDYDTWVSEPVSSMRRYIEKALGEQALEGVE